MQLIATAPGRYSPRITSVYAIDMTDTSNNNLGAPGHMFDSVPSGRYLVPELPPGFQLIMDPRRIQFMHRNEWGGALGLEFRSAAWLPAIKAR
jgi:hypothetical protein